MIALLSIEEPVASYEWVAFLAKKYFNMFLSGTWITLYVAIIGTIIGFLLGFLIGVIEDVQINREDNIFKKIIIKLVNNFCSIC